jgi:hypothetical protein
VTDDLLQDPVIARALERIPVPDYRPGFWDRLDARLDAEGPAGQQHAPAPATTVHEAITPERTTQGRPIVELTPVASLQGARIDRAARRRSLIALAAAAAVVVAVVAISLRPGHSDVHTAAGISASSSSAAPSTTAHRGAAPSPLVGPGATSGPATSALALGTSSGTVKDAATADASTPEGTFIVWAKAIQSGDAAAANALTGPRTGRYEDALGVSQDQRVSDWASAWGAWADVANPHIEVVELGTVAGARVVGIVLEQPVTVGMHATHSDALPMVQGDGGWKVEPDAFDPSSEGRLEVISPAPGPSGLSDLPSDGVVKVTAAGDGDYVLSLDLAQSTHIAAADAVDGTITWDPPDDALGPGEHLLLVAHVSDATITVLAAPFTVPG